MRRKIKAIARGAAFTILTLRPVLAFGQEEGPREIELPNPMSAHTWFIIIAVGAFLAWCISYILQLQKERELQDNRPKRSSLLQQKEELLARLTNLEAEKESGKISQSRYEKEFNKARGRLSQVLGRLGRKQESSET